MHKFNTTKVLNEVFEERMRQETKWGQQEHEAPQYLMILGEEVGEANKAALETYFHNNQKVVEVGTANKTYDDYRAELVQVAAVAVAMIECLDRNGK